MKQVFTSSFTTGSGIDNTQPYIKATDPVSGATDVPTNMRFAVQFSKAMDPASLGPHTFSMVDTTTQLAVSNSAG